MSLNENFEYSYPLIFRISQPKHMLWELEDEKHMFKFMDKKIIAFLHTKNVHIKISNYCGILQDDTASVEAATESTRFYWRQV